MILNKREIAEYAKKLEELSLKDRDRQVQIQVRENENKSAIQSIKNLYETDEEYKNLLDIDFERLNELEYVSSLLTKVNEELNLRSYQFKEKFNKLKKELEDE